MKESQSATVFGTSMQPTLFEGDLVELSPVTRHDVSSGGIYAFVDPATGRVVAHRFLKEDGDGFLFQGDNQPTPERIEAGSRLQRVERILERLNPPPPETIVYGVLRLVDDISGYRFPKNATAAWNWDKIFEFARLERLLAGLAYALKKSGLWNEVPERHRALFQTVLHEECARWERFELVRAELARLLPHARFIKGMKLGPELYPLPLLRTMRDLDVLVPPGSFDADARLLLENGFTATDEWLSRSRRFTQLGLVHRDTGVEVELHKALFLATRFAFRPEDLHASSSDELELVYLCAHAISHWGQHGISYWDIYRLVTTRRPDLGAAAALAASREALLPFCYALRVLAHDWSWEDPSYAERKLTAFQKLRLELADLFFLRRPTVPMISFQKRVFQALLTDRVSSLVRYATDPDRIALTHLSHSNDAE